MFEAKFIQFKDKGPSDKDATNKAYDAIIESAKKPSKEKNKAYGAE